MLQHKLNQAKNATFQFKKRKIYICTLSNVSFLPCLSIPKLHHVHELLTLEHSDTIISLAGVKLSCVHIYTLETTKTRLKKKH